MSEDDLDVEDDMDDEENDEDVITCIKNAKNVSFYYNV